MLALRPPSSVAAAILAGGRGRRLGGRCKPTVVVEGRRIIDRQLEVLRPLFSRVLVITNDPAPFAGLDVPLISDRVPGAGPLAGIDAALAALEAPESAVVCLAGDMPFLHPPLLRLLRDFAPQASAVVPRLGGRPEPLLARYDRGCAALIQSCLAEGRFKAADALTALEVTWLEGESLRAVDPALRSFTNVNTPQDLQRLTPPRCV